MPQPPIPFLQGGVPNVSGLQGKAGYEGGIYFSWGSANIENMPYNLFVWNAARHFRRRLDEWWEKDIRIPSGVFTISSQFIPQKTQLLVATVSNSYTVSFSHGPTLLVSKTGGVIVPHVRYRIPANYTEDCDGLHVETGAKRWQHFYEVQWGPDYHQDFMENAMMNGRYMWSEGSNRSRIGWKRNRDRNSKFFDTYFPIQGYLSANIPEIQGAYYLCYDTTAQPHWGIILRHNTFIQTASLVSQMVAKLNLLAKQELTRVYMENQFSGQYDGPSIGEIWNDNIVYMHTGVRGTKNLSTIKLKKPKGELIDI